MTRLYILYDAKCALCRNCRVWLSQRPLARRACTLISQNRQALSGWLAGSSDGEIRTHLSAVRDVPCRDNSYCKTR
jgi:predicted DCC family thiol-disulfide oxidoreductase YuxK